MLSSASTQELLRLERELRLEHGFVTALAWSPKGDRLAIGGILGGVFVMNAEGKQVAKLREDTSSYSSSVMDLCWSSDSEHLVVAGRENGLYLMDVARGDLLATQPSAGGPVVRIPGTSDYVCIGEKKNPQRIDGETLARMMAIDLPPGGPAARLAVSPDGQHLAVSTSHDCRLYLFDLSTGGVVKKMAGEDFRFGLSWLPGEADPCWLSASALYAFGKTKRRGGGAMVAHGTGDAARVAVRTSSEGWTIHHASGKATFLGRETGVLALHPDGTGWARGDGGQVDFGRRAKVTHSIAAPVAFANIFFGRLADHGRIALFRGFRSPPLSAFALPSGDPVSVAGIPSQGDFVRYQDGPELVWSTTAGLAWWTLRSGGVPKLKRSFEYKPFPIMLGIYGEVRLHDDWLSQSNAAVVDTRGERQSPWPDYSGGTTLPVRGGETAWVIGTASRLRFLRKDGKTVVRDVPRVEGLVDVAVSPSGSHVACADPLGPARIFDVATGEVVGRVGEEEGLVVHGIRFLDDARVIAITGNAASIRLSISSIGLRGAVEKQAALTLSDRPERDYWQLLDVSLDARRALVGSPGVGRVFTWD
ncbi:MAG: WD40 repeat domain-containing protein [bacterium]|nr:WD40 repeat domain-containing protein [bacterium]